MTQKNKPPTDVSQREFVFSRIFDAPRELVFQAWTDPAHLARWWGPKGFTNPVCEWDARPGGKIYDVMRAPNGTDYPMGGTFREIVAPERLVFVCGALDEAGMMLFEIQHTATFSDLNGQTTLTLRSRVTMTTPGADRYIGGFETGMTLSLERLTDLVADKFNCEIVHNRVYQAPRELVWRAMTDPEFVVDWWGPRGFTTTITKMEVRTGGRWEHVMRGPDGTNYPNKRVFNEVMPLERIVYTHGGRREGGPGVNFTATWTFEEIAPGQTRLTGRMVFATKEARDLVVREFGAIEGAKQTFERLGEQLSGMLSPPFTLSREFAAPRELVWKVWTDPEHLRRWFGPKGFTMPTCAMEFRPGGVFHYGMKSPDGHEMWGKWTFLEIAPPEKLVLINSFSDANGGVTRHPMSATWPLETLSATTFTERDGKTTLTLRWLPHNATEVERQTFDTSHAGMTQGWSGTMAQLETYLAMIKEGS